MGRRAAPSNRGLGYHIYQMCIWYSSFMANLLLLWALAVAGAAFVTVFDARRKSIESAMDMVGGKYPPALCEMGCIR